MRQLYYTGFMFVSLYVRYISLSLSLSLVLSCVLPLSCSLRINTPLSPIPSSTLVCSFFCILSQVFHCICIFSLYFFQNCLEFLFVTLQSFINESCCKSYFPCKFSDSSSFRDFALYLLDVIGDFRNFLFDFLGHNWNFRFNLLSLLVWLTLVLCTQPYEPNIRSAVNVLFTFLLFAALICFDDA